MFSLPTVTQRSWPTSAVGADVGVAVVGDRDGAAVGVADGDADGASVGASDGTAVGVADGLAVGFDVGVAVGAKDGAAVGGSDGAADGAGVGLVVGAFESQKLKPFGHTMLFGWNVTHRPDPSRALQCPTLLTQSSHRSNPTVSGQFRKPAAQS